MKFRVRVAVAGAVLSALRCIAQTPLADSPQIEHRIDGMLAKMSLEQKIELLGGKEAYYHLLFDGKQIAAQETAESQITHSLEIELAAGKAVQVQYDLLPSTPDIWTGLAIVPMDELISPEATKMAAMADVAIVSVGFDTTTKSEGTDRNFQEFRKCA